MMRAGRSDLPKGWVVTGQSQIRVWQYLGSTILRPVAGADPRRRIVRPEVHVAKRIPANYASRSRARPLATLQPPYFKRRNPIGSLTPADGKPAGVTGAIRAGRLERLHTKQPPTAIALANGGQKSALALASSGGQRRTEAVIRGQNPVAVAACSP